MLLLLVLLGGSGDVLIRAPEAAVAQDRFGPALNMSDPGCRGRACIEQVFSRPAGCRLRRRTRSRRTYTCEREDTLIVRVADGVVRERADGLSRRARNPYPGELLGQWRRCPFRQDRALARFAHLYEDPDIGPCYVLRLDPAPSAPARRTRLLSDVHPYIAGCVQDMVDRTTALGHEVRVISGLRAPKRTRGKRGKRTYKGGGWHAFGLAVDLYVGRYQGLKKATAAFLSGRDAAIWNRLGELGEQCGLKWLGRTDPGEIFHFEWHPGWPGMPRGALYQRLARVFHRAGLASIWRELRYQPRRKTAFKHLRDR